MNHYLDEAIAAVMLMANARVTKKEPTPEEKQAMEIRRKRILEQVLFERKVAEYRKTAGRNDPCPCGSGKKLKKCCMIFKPTENPEE